MGAKENSVKFEVEIECGLDMALPLLSDVEWFMLSGETPLKERNHRRKIKAKAWNIIELCTWIGKKVILRLHNRH